MPAPKRVITTRAPRASAASDARAESPTGRNRRERDDPTPIDSQAPASPVSNNVPETPDVVPPTAADFSRGRQNDGRRSGSPTPSTPSNRGASSSARRSAAGKVNLNNFETSWKAVQAINSPRSLAVCAKFGINPSELVHQPYETFAIAAGVSDAIARRRYEHAESKRQQKLVLLRAERADLARDEEGDGSQPLYTPRSRTPTLTSPQRDSAQRLRLSQQSRLAELEAERKEKAQRLTEELELRTALAFAQKLSHEQDIVASAARDHLRHVEETALNAKRILATNSAAKRDSATRHELERAIKSLDAQAGLLRVAQHRGQRHEESVSEARQRASSATASARSKHERHVARQEEEARKCEQRHEQFMSRRSQNNQAHGAVVADSNRHAHQLAWTKTEIKRHQIELKEDSVERRLEDRTLQEERDRALRAQERQHREVEAKAAALTHAQVVKMKKQQKLETQLEAFEDRKARTTEEALWGSEMRREAVMDRAEEVARVRRAREYERRQHLHHMHGKHGCGPLAGEQ